ncbi:MAG: DNA polymerase ligase N-terminal domain-containing protein [bacterium]
MDGGKRFVVHKHQASRLHYDFRLEVDGALKSWAVPKGVPETPGARRLAVQVDDHDLDYITFEGVIEEGYGAGTVEIWDTGTYALEDRKPGKLVFEMKGKKLHGTYVLVRMEGKGEKNWLIFKKNS